MQSGNQPPNSAAGYLIRQGAISGVFAGISFVAFGMLMALLLDGDFLKPLRMMATITLGENALAQWNSLLAVTLHGLFLLILFAGIFGALFGHMVSRQRFIALSSKRLILAGSLYGTLLWLTIFYIVAPVLGWIWFPLDNNPLLEGFVGYTLFFGAVLGLVFARRLHPGVAASPGIPKR